MPTNKNLRINCTWTILSFPPSSDLPFAFSAHNGDRLCVIAHSVTGCCGQIFEQQHSLHWYEPQCRKIWPQWACHYFGISLAQNELRAFRVLGSSQYCTSTVVRYCSGGQWQQQPSVLIRYVNKGASGCAWGVRLISWNSDHVVRVRTRPLSKGTTIWTILSMLQYQRWTNTVLSS